MRRTDETTLCGSPPPELQTRSLTGGQFGAFAWDRAQGVVEWELPGLTPDAAPRRGTLDVTQLPMMIPGRAQPDYGFGRYDIDAVRWRAGGMQLRPGETASVAFRRRAWDDAKRSWFWEYPVGANGLVQLAQNTRIVAVDVVVVRLRGDECDANVRSASRFTREDAEVWLDGRSVDVLRTTVGLSDRQLGVAILDRDPRPTWTESVFNDAGAGRTQNRLMQDPDNVFAQCGARFGLGVQFRLRRFEVAIFDRTEPCGEFAANGSMVASCLSTAAVRAFGTESGPPTALRLYIVRQFAGATTAGGAVAQAFDTNVVLGLHDIERAARSNIQNLVAHELGHALNQFSPLFNDGYADPSDGPDNLMSTWGNRLTRAQCETSYANAASFAFP